MTFHVRVYDDKGKLLKRAPVGLDSPVYRECKMIGDTGSDGTLTYYVSGYDNFRAGTISFRFYANGLSSTVKVKVNPYAVDTDLRGFANVSGAQLDAAMKAYRANDNGLIGLGQTFVDVGRQFLIDPFYIAAHAAWESGWGTSRISRNKNNLFGYGAYDKAPYDSALTFKTKADCVKYVMPLVRRDYLSGNGKYYHGGTLKGMNVHYATDPNWKNGIALIMRGLSSKTAR